MVTNPLSRAFPELSPVACCDSPLRVYACPGLFARTELKSAVPSFAKLVFAMVQCESGVVSRPSLVPHSGLWFFHVVEIETD